MSDKGWVLVTDSAWGQDRASLAAVRALAAGGYRSAVAVSGPGSLAAASRYCARHVLVPPPEDPRFAASVRHLLEDGAYLTVLPSSDAALAALGEPVGHLIDKTSLAEHASRAGLVAPPGDVFTSEEELAAAASRLAYPVVVKSSLKTRTSVRPAFRADTPAALNGWASGPVIVQPFVTDPVHAVGGVVWKGELVAAVHQRYIRTWPADCGTASAALTTEPDPGLEEKLLRLLEGFEGIFQAQFAGPYLLDVNPRVYGSLPLAVAAGVNLASLWCDLLRGEAPVRVRARPGVRFRWLEGDVRNLYGSWRRGRARAGQAARALLPHPGTAHSTASWRDPGPALARIRYVASRLRRGGHSR